MITFSLLEIRTGKSPLRGCPGEMSVHAQKGIVRRENDGREDVKRGERYGR
jgi:hypothetical protein